VGDHVAMSTEPIWSLVEAAEHTNTSRATLQRLATSGKIPGAHKDARGWKVPMSGLIAAGLTVEATPRASTQEQARIETTAELRDAIAEAERWRTRAEGLERELQRADESLRQLRASMDALTLALEMINDGRTTRTNEQTSTGWIVATTKEEPKHAPSTTERSSLFARAMRRTRKTSK
jgi:hypothetical protein